jgi:hypothetical protein
MKKLTLVLLAISFFALELKAQSFGDPYIIDTVVMTSYGISVSNVAVQFKVHSNYGVDTTIMYEFRMFADTSALNNGDRTISVLSNLTNNIFTYCKKTYTIAEFIALDFIKMDADVKEILEKQFGNNINK